MTVKKRLLTILVCAVLVIAPLTVSHAGVTTLGIYFCGLAENAAEGTAPRILNGSFEVWQNGSLIGTIRAGQDVLTLTDSADVTIKPVMSTMPEGWNIDPAGYVQKLPDAGNATVPLCVYSAGGEDAAGENVTGTKTREPDAESEKDDPAAAEDEAYMPETADDDEIYTGEVVPEMPEATLPPDTLSEAENGGTVRVRVFNDRNGNGVYAKGEGFISGVSVTLTDEHGDSLTLTTTDGTPDGILEFANLPESAYTVSVTLPAGYGFTKKGNSGSAIDDSATDTSASGVQDAGVCSVTAGSVTELAAGVWKTPHASGFCWNDLNGDGRYQNGEPAIAGVHVQLSGQKNGLQYETYSDADGNWYIDRLKPGFYDLYVDVPSGMMFTRYSAEGGKRSIFTNEGSKRGRKVIDTNKGESFDGQNIGFIKSAEIYGICFLDANYNGLYDEGEEPIPGVKVEAWKQVNDETVATTVSGDDGTFLLTCMRGRTYRLRAVLPDTGITFTKVVANEDGNHFLSRDGRREYYLNEQVINDGERRYLAVGAIVPASLSGTAYLDDDLSGTLSGKEKTVSGLAVTLLDEQGNVVATDRTNVKGKYVFEGLTPGRYQLSLNAKAGYAFTKKGDGSVITNTSAGGGVSDMIEVPMGADITGMDMGMILPACVSGTLFSDDNDNGKRDAGENGLTEVKVHLIAADGTTAFTRNVNRDATYTFDAVMPGEYKLRFELPENAIFAKTVSGGNTFEDLGGYAESEMFSLGSDGKYTADLCGTLLLGSLDGMTFADTNGSGTRDGDEPALAGVTLTLTPSREDLESVSVTTGEDGAFAFTGIHPDQWTLRIDMPDGRVISRTTALKLPLTAGSSGDATALDIPTGYRVNGEAIGCVIPASLSGRMWMDENNNGRFDELEMTPEGETVTVMDDITGRVFAELQTDAEGRFATAGMIPGSFTVSYTPDKRTHGSLPGDSTFDETNGRLEMTGIVLNENESADDILLGVVRETSLGGHVWVDLGGEITALSGAVIDLNNAQTGETISRATSDEDGAYRFDGLMPLDYELTVVMPQDHAVVLPDDERLRDGQISVMMYCDGRNGSSDPISLKMGVDLTEEDIGAVLAGKLGDLCWLDENGNGWQETDEPGIPGVKIELMRNGKTVAETVSDAYGYYCFTDVYPAVYTLRVTPPAEVRPTEHRTDIPLIDSALIETDDTVCETEEVSVVSGKANYNVDLGFIVRVKGVLPDGLNEGATRDWSWRPVKE